MNVPEVVTPSPAARSTRSAMVLSAAALGFVVFYVLVDVVSSPLATSALPLPNDPASKTRDWYATNQLAAVTAGVLQLLSVSCLAAFGGVLASGRRVRALAFAAAGMMAVSCVSSWILAAVAPTASVPTVATLRSVSFIAGGTAHVFLLGAFVLTASLMPGFGKPMRVFAIVAAVVAVVSLSSLVWFNGSAFILLGRLLCMAWVVSAAVRVVWVSRRSGGRRGALHTTPPGGASAR